MENAVAHFLVTQYDGADDENRIGGRTTLNPRKIMRQLKCLKYNGNRLYC